MVRSTVETGWGVLGGMLMLASPALAEGPGIKSPRSVLPMMTVTVPDPTPATGSIAQAAAIGGYSRLEVTYQSIDPDDPIRNYNEERRGFLARYFAGKTIARLLTVRTTVSRPLVTTSATLVSIGLTSNRKSGESWTSQIDPRRLLTPFIRIDSDSAVKVEATTTATSSYELSPATGLLDIVKRGAQLVAPQTTLLTSLNKDRFQDATAFIDESLSNLLQQAITERVANDFPFREWAGHDLLTIEVSLPVANVITPPRTGGKPHEGFRRIGKWTVRSTAPVLSVFADVPFVRTEEMTDIYTAAAGKTGRRAAHHLPTACDEKFKRELQQACRAFRALDPQTVLGFPVDSAVPLGQALAGDAAVAAAREKLVSDKRGTNTESAYALCTVIADKAYRLGFNRVDTAVILWAYASQSFITKDASATIREIANCAPLAVAYSLGLPEGTFAGDPKPVGVQRSSEQAQQQSVTQGAPGGAGTPIIPMVPATIPPAIPPVASTAPAMPTAPR